MSRVGVRRGIVFGGFPQCSSAGSCLGWGLGFVCDVF